jgi:hypothetical protein
VAQAAIDRISRMKPRIIAKRPETSMTTRRMMSRIVIGMDLNLGGLESR